MWFRAGFVASTLALFALVACTLLKPSDDELRGNGAGNGGSAGNGGNGGSGGSGIGDSSFGGGLNKCSATLNWQTKELGGTSSISGPLLVERESDLALAWSESGQVFVRSVARNSLMPTSPTTVSSGGGAKGLRMAFNPTSKDLGLTWFGADFEFASVGSDNSVKQQHAITSSPSGKGPVDWGASAIAPIPGSDHWAIAWQGFGDFAYRIYGFETDASGASVTNIGGENYTRLTDSASDCGNKQHPSLVATDTELELAYASSFNACKTGGPDPNAAEPPDIWLLPVTSTVEAKTPSVLEKDSGTSEFPALAWNGSAFGVAWIDDRQDGPRVWFAQAGVTTTSVKVSDDAPTADKPPSVAVGSDGFGVAWQSGTSIYFASITGGAPDYPPVQIANDASSDDTPSVIWSDNRWLVAWSKTTAQISFCAP